MPYVNLGRSYSLWFVEADGQTLPDPVRQATTAVDVAWLHTRMGHVP
jgi:hypothetical protein